MEKKKSSVLLIDCLRRKPKLTRVRSVGVDAGRTHTDTILSISMVSGFHKYRLQNSCNNLLCFAKYHNDGGSVCLLDLAAKKLITLPDSSPDTTTSYYGLGFDNQTKKHKTLRIDVEDVIDTNAFSNTVINARINTLGTDTWEPVKSELPSVSIFGKPLVLEGGSALVWADFLEGGSALVWADFPQTASSKSRCVTVFNVSEEKFSRIALPQHIQVGHLVALKDRLCAVDLSSNLAIHIWILEDLYADCPLWSSLCTIKMRETNGLNDHAMTRVLGELQNGEMFLKSCGAYLVYESETERFEYVHLPVARDPESEVHCYAGSLTSADELNCYFEVFSIK